MNIYVASSWKNAVQPEVVSALRAEGHEVYDFKNPPDGAGFGWEEVGEYSGDGLVDPIEYLEWMLPHPRAKKGFAADYGAMQAADACVLVLPCNRSAHLELGWFVGQGRPTCIILDAPEVTPELMYLMVDHIAPNLHSALAWLERLRD